MGFLLNFASFFLCFFFQISYTFPSPFLTSTAVAADETVFTVTDGVPVTAPCGFSSSSFCFVFLSFFGVFYARRESISVRARKEITVRRI